MQVILTPNKVEEIKWLQKKKWIQETRYLILFWSEEQLEMKHKIVKTYTIFLRE